MNLIKPLKLYLRVLAIGMRVSVLRHSDLQSSMIPWYLWQSFVITVSTTKWEVLWAATVFELRSSPRHFWGRPWSIQHSNTHAAETYLVQWIILIIHSVYRMEFYFKRNKNCYSIPLSLSVVGLPFLCEEGMFDVAEKKKKIK